MSAEQDTWETANRVGEEIADLAEQFGANFDIDADGIVVMSFDSMPLDDFVTSVLRVGNVARPINFKTDPTAEGVIRGAAKAEVERQRRAVGVNIVRLLGVQI